MKTFSRLIRRYVLAAAGIIAMLITFTIGLIVWIGWRESNRNMQREFDSGAIAQAIVCSDAGLAFGPEHTPEDWMNGYAWAMVLDEDGQVIWHDSAAGIWMATRCSAGRRTMGSLSSAWTAAAFGGTIYIPLRGCCWISAKALFRLFVSCC